MCLCEGCIALKWFWVSELWFSTHFVWFRILTKPLRNSVAESNFRFPHVPCITTMYRSESCYMVSRMLNPKSTDVIQNQVTMEFECTNAPVGRLLVIPNF